MPRHAERSVKQQRQVTAADLLPARRLLVWLAGSHVELRRAEHSVTQHLQATSGDLLSRRREIGWWRRSDRRQGGTCRWLWWEVEVDSPGGGGAGGRAPPRAGPARAVLASGKQHRQHKASGVRDLIMTSDGAFLRREGPESEPATA